MAKFKQTINKTMKAADYTVESLQGCKDPWNSYTPFKDGQEVVFEGFVTVCWKHEDYGDGKYIAIKFKDFKAPLAFTSVIKEVTAYKDKELKVIANFANSGGLADVMSAHREDGGITTDLLLDIEDFFKGKKYKIVLTYYYDRKFNNTTRRSLINVHRCEDIK